MSDVAEPIFVETTGTITRLCGFDGQFQAQSTWCWAATASSVHHYMMNVLRTILSSQHAFSFRPQCYFVNRQHSGRTCRDNIHLLFPPRAENCQERGCSVRD